MDGLVDPLVAQLVADQIVYIDDTEEIDVRISSSCPAARQYGRA
jgi:hypothetical protein